MEIAHFSYCILPQSGIPFLLYYNQSLGSQTSEKALFFYALPQNWFFTNYLTTNNNNFDHPIYKRLSILLLTSIKSTEQISAPWTISFRSRIVLVLIAASLIVTYSSS